MRECGRRDYLAHNKVQLVWGPGRHIIGHNVAIYHRNPDLVRVEIFTEMDQMKDEDLGYFDPRPWHHPASNCLLLSSSSSGFSPRFSS